MLRLSRQHVYLAEEKIVYKNRCYMPFILYPPDMYDVSAGQQLEELQRTLSLEKAGTDFVMYLSVPYCRVRCKACPYFVDFLPKASERKDGVLDRYISALIKDLKRHASTERWGKARLRGVYIGGGTGSVLDIRHLDQILTTLQDRFNLTEDAEITLATGSEIGSHPRT